MGCSCRGRCSWGRSIVEIVVGTPWMPGTWCPWPWTRRRHLDCSPILCSCPVRSRIASSLWNWCTFASSGCSCCCCRAQWWACCRIVRIFRPQPGKWTSIWDRSHYWRGPWSRSMRYWTGAGCDGIWPWDWSIQSPRSWCIQGVLKPEQMPYCWWAWWFACEINL